MQEFNVFDDQNQNLVPKRLSRFRAAAVYDLTVCVSVCVPGRGSGCVIHVYEHCWGIHQLPVGPGSASGLPGDAALHRGSAATRDGEPETGESTATATPLARGRTCSRCPLVMTVLTEFLPFTVCSIQ